MNSQSRSHQQGLTFVGVGGLALLVIAGATLMSLVTVQAGHRGVKTRFGRIIGHALKPGLHVKIPIMDDIVSIEVREQNLPLETSASSKDLQTVQSRIVVNFHPLQDEVANLYSDIGIEYKARILDPAVEETVKAITAQYTAEQLISQRTEVREKMMDMLSKRVLDSHVKITKFNIVNFEFSKSFNDAIEAKQNAEQSALQAQNELRRIQVEADQQIETARGRAESLRLQARAEADSILAKAEAEAKAQELLAKVVNRDVIALRAIEKWDGIMPRVTGEVVPFIGVQDESPSR